MAMFVSYIVYKKSWIVLVGVLLFLTNALIQLDAGITVNPYSLLYLNILFLVTFLCFFIWRYKCETSYLKSIRTLIDQMEEDWIENLPSPSNRFPDGLMYSF